jgi:hypothetical protein
MVVGRTVQVRRGLRLGGHSHGAGGMGDGECEKDSKLTCVQASVETAVSPEERELLLEHGEKACPDYRSS